MGTGYNGAVCSSVSNGSPKLIPPVDGDIARPVRGGTCAAGSDMTSTEAAVDAGEGHIHSSHLRAQFPHVSACSSHFFLLLRPAVH